MSGLLHLRGVPQFSDNDIDRITKTLRRCIRKFCDTSKGRMIPLEDECHKLLSWFPLVQGHSYLVRVANVSAAGKPFANLSFASGLYDRVCESLDGDGYTLIQAGDRYDYLYHPTVFEGTDFLYVPNSVYCNTLVALRGKV